MYDDILLPTDGSSGMDEVIDHATSLASEHDATIHGIYVVETASITSLPMETSMEGISQALREEGREAIEDLEEQVEDVDVETDIVDGTPGKQIANTAAERDCDLVIMGTHGRSGVDRFLLGSVAERVVRSSPVPVLTVRVSSSGSVTDPHPRR
jgi:nucleotide-binding universal stress UspA family protein